MDTRGLFLILSMALLVLVGTGLGSPLDDQPSKTKPTEELAKIDSELDDLSASPNLPPLRFPVDGNKFVIKETNKTMLEILTHHRFSSEKLNPRIDTAKVTDDVAIEEAKKEDQDYYHDSAEDSSKNDVSDYQPTRGEDKDELEEKFGKPTTKPIAAKIVPEEHSTGHPTVTIVVVTLFSTIALSVLAISFYRKRNNHARRGQVLINEDDNESWPQH